MEDRMQGTIQRGGQSRSETVARANEVKNVWLRMAQIGRRKSATMNLTHFVGTISGAEKDFTRPFGTM